LKWIWLAVVFLGACVANSKEKSQSVNEIQQTFPEIVVGRVAKLIDDEKLNLRVEIQDQGTWIVPSGVSVDRFRASFEVARDRNENILFLASATSRQIGDVAASTVGLPLLDKTTQLDSTLAYTIFPSPRFYYLNKKNPRFLDIKNKISAETIRTGGSPADPQLRIYYLPESGEIIDVRQKLGSPA
jgi:hypothetical protein